MKKSQLKQLIKEVLEESAFTPTDNTVMIYIDGKYPYYLKKENDTTHFDMVYDNPEALNRKGLSQGMHIGQHKSEPYYNDVRSWLKNGLSSKELNGRKY